MAEETIKFKLNGKAVKLSTDADRKLLWVLRTDCELTGTKYGCGEGLCGACTVLVDGVAVRSCQISLKDIQGKDVVTIEGLSMGDQLHPLQKAFAENDALQCGYCTSGMIMNAYSLLKKNPKPSVSNIVHGMEDNICRCGAHKRIIEAIQSCAKEMKGGMKP